MESEAGQLGLLDGRISDYKIKKWIYLYYNIICAVN